MAVVVVVVAVVVVVEWKGKMVEREEGRRKVRRLCGRSKRTFYYSDTVYGMDTQKKNKGRSS